MIHEKFYPDRDSLFTALTQDCQSRLQQALQANSAASFLVSGGSTPKPLYQSLSHCGLAWENIQVALVDERWVAPGQTGSNQTFIEQSLLQNNAATAQYIPTKTPHPTATAGLADCEANYQQLTRPFDLVILGMGPDAHTASLFPQAQGLAAALDPNQQQLCSAITAIPSDVTGELVERLSLSLYGLLQARQLHLLITGEDKLAVYRQALANQDVLQSPISAVLHQQQIPVYIYWAP